VHCVPYHVRAHHGWYVSDCHATGCYFIVVCTADPSATEDPASDAAASEEPDSANFDFPASWGPINEDDSWFPTAEPTSAADEGGQ
jgi:hypothetical protein